MFEIKGKAEVRSLNVSKGNQEEAPVCVTLGMLFENQPAEPAIAALGCMPEDIDGLFKEEDSRFSGIEEIVTWASFEDVHQLKMLSFTMEVAKIKKIHLKPIGGKRFNITLNVQLQEPKAHVIEKIAGKLHLAVMVEITDKGSLGI